MAVVHWDEVETARRAKGEMDATWQHLGRAAGARQAGLNRVRVAPGRLPTPPHSHGASEEVYYVLGGSGLLWQDGEVHEVRPRDCVIQRADELEHTFVAGPEGLDFLVFGTRHPTEIGWLPRSRAVRFGWPWVEGRDDDPWDVEAGLEPLAYGDPASRPANVRNVDEVPLDVFRAASTATLASREDTELAGFHWERLEPSRRGSPPHCHSEEEEIFVILEGEATLELWPRNRPDVEAAIGEEIPVRPGHVIVRPAGTGVSHSFMPGPEGVAMLIYGMRKPGDVCWYPRSQKLNWRGLGVIGRIQTLDYDDGEPIE